MFMYISQSSLGPISSSIYSILKAAKSLHGLHIAHIYLGFWFVIVYVWFSVELPVILTSL